MEAGRIRAAKSQQAYDPDPPRCGTCVYFNRGSAKRRREAAKRGWTLEKARLAKEQHTDWAAPELQRCTFGNFRTGPYAVCDEWRNKAGERIEQDAHKAQEESNG